MRHFHTKPEGLTPHDGNIRPFIIGNRECRPPSMPPRAAEVAACRRVLKKRARRRGREACRQEDPDE